jgi:aminoglycoside phosphotransferase family enzyme/predicted kinase
MADPNPTDIADLFDPPPDRMIETHISRVYLSGDRAFKLKRAVLLPYVDFSTLERRRIACAREVTLNRRTAPQLYLGARAVYRDASGRLGFAPHGPAVEWLVEMQRFDADQTFDRLLARQMLTPALIEATADAIAAFQHAAEPVGRGADAAIDQAMAINAAAFERRDPDALPLDAVAAFQAAQRGNRQAMGPALARRRAVGRMRHGHGDLHLRNIALIDGRPVLFDCLEFDDDMAAIDTLYDMAFLLMDLLAAGRRDLASIALNRYLDRVGDDDGVALLPLYVAVRAAVRCHIAALQASGRPDALRYFTLGMAALAPQPPRLIAIGGLSGSGKSALARRLAPAFGEPCGAVVLRSDTIRKALYGIAPEQRLPADSYTAESSQRVYAAMQARAERLLAAGATVILDAVFGREDERQAAVGLARAAGSRFDGLWLTAPSALLEARVAGRSGDASDATVDVVRWQQDHLDSPRDWAVIDTAGGQERSAAAAVAILLGQAAARIPGRG